MSAQLEVATVEEKRLDAEQKVHFRDGGHVLFEYIFHQLFDFKFRGRAAFALRGMISESLSREVWLSLGFATWRSSLHFM